MLQDSHFISSASYYLLAKQPTSSLAAPSLPPLSPPRSTVLPTKPYGRTSFSKTCKFWERTGGRRGTHFLLLRLPIPKYHNTEKVIFSYIKKKTEPDKKKFLAIVPVSYSLVIYIKYCGPACIWGRGAVCSSSGTSLNTRNSRSKLSLNASIAAMFPHR